jgi:hypothetical protein
LDLRQPLGIAKKVLEKFHSVKLHYWRILEEEPLTVQASVAVRYGLESTNLVGKAALHQILRQTLDINGESMGWSSPPLDTQGQIHLICELIAHGIDINKPYPKLNGEDEKDSITPMTQATGQNNQTLIKFLLSHGAEITPAVLRSLSRSISFGIEEAVQIMEIFVSSGASINMYDELGGIMHTNFFHYEAHSKFLEFLLERGLSTQITNQEGKSLLHVAAEATDRKQCSMLIAHGEGLYLKDLQGQSPLYVAHGDNFKEYLEARFKEYQEKQAKEPQVRGCPSLEKFELKLSKKADEEALKESLDQCADAEKSKEGAANSYSDITVLEINPQIKAKDARHCMVIICDVDVSDTDGVFTGSSSELGYTGHYYVGLGELTDGVVSKMHSYKGYNPVQRAPVERGIVEDEEKRYEKAKEAEIVHGIGKLKAEKAIPLTEAQYSTVRLFFDYKKEQPGTYIGGFHDCITFTQDVLDKIGLSHYKVGDLVSLGKDSKITLATLSGGLRGLDNRIVEAMCKEEVAQKYNVPLDRIDDIPVILGEVPKFRIIPLNQYLKMKEQGEK